MTTVQGDSYSQTFHMGSHIHGLKGDHLEIQAPGVKVHSLLGDTWPRPCTWGHISSFQGNRLSQTLHLVSHIHILHGDPTSLELLPLVTCT